MQQTEGGWGLWATIEWPTDIPEPVPPQGLLLRNTSSGPFGAHVSVAPGLAVAVAATGSGVGLDVNWTSGLPEARRMVLRLDLIAVEDTGEQLPPTPDGDTAPRTGWTDAARAWGAPVNSGGTASPHTLLRVVMPVAMRQPDGMGPAPSPGTYWLNNVVARLFPGEVRIFATFDD